MVKITDWPDQWQGDLEDGKAKAREVEGGVSMELKPAREVASMLNSGASGLEMLEGEVLGLNIDAVTDVIRADRLAVIDRCIADILALDSKLICDAKGKVLGGSFKRFAPMVDRNMVFAALEKLKEEIT